ncbi:MAG: DUF3800 domain-containing protein [Polyangiaceae bacterium]
MSNSHEFRDGKAARPIEETFAGNPGGNEPPDSIGVPGYKNYRGYFDESGFHRAGHYGFGALFIPDERRGSLTGLYKELADKHGFDLELKWTKTSRKFRDFTLAIVDEFFRRNWMMFHCFIAERKYVDMRFHDDIEDARQKHFTLFVQKKIAFLNNGSNGKAYHLVADVLPYSYSRAGEVVHKIAASELKKSVGHQDLIRSFTQCDSKKVRGIQIADLLLGAVLAARQGDVEAASKLAVMQSIADHLGWSDLKSDTMPTEEKFNIWNFQDPNDPRRSKTRAVKLKYPHGKLRGK